MAAFLIIQECVVLALAALLGLLWWSTRQASKTIAAESERRAELLYRMTRAYGAVKAEVEQWRALQLRVDCCPVRLPTPADYAAVNGSGRPPRRQQCGPWHKVIDEPLSFAQEEIRPPRITDPGLTRRAGVFRIDYAAEWMRGDRKPYGARAIVSTRFYTEGLGGTAGLGGSEVVIFLEHVPARAALPDFDDELGELETAGGWYHVRPTNQPAATAAGETTMQGVSNDD